MTPLPEWKRVEAAVIKRLGLTPPPEEQTKRKGE